MKAEVSFEGVTSVFHIHNAFDVIQSCQSAGKFYELHQLIAHRNLIPAQCTVIDCGANVGNHTIFYARHTGATCVYPLEANPKASWLLRDNIDTNIEVRSEIDTSHVGLAIGAVRGYLTSLWNSRNNLGATRFGVDNSGYVPCVPLDELHFEGPIRFIKIDVEGMEMDVLYGAERLLKEHRPAIAIEVDPANEAAFWEWAHRHRYVPVGAFFDYVHVRNYLMISTY